MRGTLRLLVGAGILAAAVGSTTAQPCNDYAAYMSQLTALYPPGLLEGAGFTGLAVKSCRAYVYETLWSYMPGKLHVLDLTDPAAPVLRGQIQCPPTQCYSLACIDHYVLMAADDLYCFDVDDEDHPQLVFTLGAADPVRDVALYVRLAYVALESGQLQVYDVNAPATPELQTTLASPFPARRLAVVGDRLLLGGVNGFAIYSLVAPTAPALLGSLPLPGTVTALAGEDSLVLAGGASVYVIDIANAAAPEVVSSGFVTQVISCALRGGVAWFGCNPAADGGSLERWSLAEPSAPVRIGRDVEHGYPQAMAFAQGNVYTADWGEYYDGMCYVEGLHVFGPGDPASPPLLGWLDLDHNYAYGSSGLSGDLLYMMGETAVGVVDLSDPSSPALVGSTTIIGGFGLGGALVGGHLVVRMHTWDFSAYFLQIFDLSNPVHPVAHGALEEYGGMSARDDLLYLATGNGIEVFRMLPSAELQPVGSFWDGAVYPPIFDGAHAAAGLSSGAIRLAEFMKPADPIVGGKIPEPGDGGGRSPLCYAGGLLFVRRDLPGSQFPRFDSWEIWDVSDPVSPVLLAVQPLPCLDQVNAMTMRDGVLYVAETRQTSVWDMTDPAAPLHLGDRPHQAMEASNCLHQRQDDLVVTSYLGHILTIPYECPVAPTGIQEADHAPRAPQLSMWASPNPLNPRTQLLFSLPAAAVIDLSLYDLAGRRVKVLLHGSLQSGPHTCLWEGNDDGGRAVATGVYVARLRAGSRQATARLVLLR